jgi:hypothetical protein
MKTPIVINPKTIFWGLLDIKGVLLIPFFFEGMSSVIQNSFYLVQSALYFLLFSGGSFFRNYKDTHRNKPENYFLGATRYQGCLVNSLFSPI